MELFVKDIPIESINIDNIYRTRIKNQWIFQYNILSNYTKSIFFSIIFPDDIILHIILLCTKMERLLVYSRNVCHCPNVMCQYIYYHNIYNNGSVSLFNKQLLDRLTYIDWNKYFGVTHCYNSQYCHSIANNYYTCKICEQKYCSKCVLDLCLCFRCDRKFGIIG
jgi:hypothetical protein